MMKKTTPYSKDYFQKRDALPSHFAETLRLLLKEKRVKKVLDVGGGTGRLVQFLNQAGFQAIGCDSSNWACKISGQIKANATSLPFKKNLFDAVLAISLIEHLTKEEGVKFLQEAYRVLKNGGVIFIVTPNLWSPLRFFQKKNWFGYLDRTHLTFYNPFTLAGLLKKEGFNNFCFWFKIPKNSTFDCPFFNLTGKLPKKIADLVSFLIISTPLALIRDGIWLCAQK